MELCLRKLPFVVFALTAGLVVAIASSSLLGVGPHWLGSARHRSHPLMPDHSALSNRGRATTIAATDSRTQAERSKVRTMLSAELAAEIAAIRRLAKAAGLHPRPVTLRLCHRYQHVAAFGSYGAGLVVRNDNYGGRGECLANKNRWANFAVSSSAARRAGSEPAAFPNIFYGCSWGVCSPGTTLPRRLNRLSETVTSWYTRGHPGGQWDVAYDIWFARKRHTSGQDRGAEIMLWLRSKGLGRPAAHGMLIGRRRWQLEHWLTRNPNTGASWPLIIFRMVHPHGFVRHLDLMPFFHRAEALGLLDRKWWLTAVEAGFEVWRGGAGLRTTSFSVHLK
jgi:hypothetical protein